MAGANWRPDAWFGVNLLSDPNDLYGIPQWVEVTTGVRRVSGYERGRDYELDQAMSSEPTIDLRDVPETFNPVNPSSPYAGKILPYREICAMMQHPATGGAATGNMFNANAWVPNDGDALDGSFESFTTGYAPNFLAAVGNATAALVTATTPFQGTKAATWDVGAVASQNGQRLLVRTIPGRQYTTSLYVRQSSANVQRIGIGGVTTGVDSFNSRTASNGLGQAEGPSGAVVAPTWSSVGGAAADYSVSGGVARQSHSAASSSRTNVLGVAVEDANVYATVKIPAVASGSAIYARMVTNYVDSSNYNLSGVRFNTDGTMSAIMLKVVAGIPTTLATALIPGLTYTAGSRWRIRAYLVGQTISVKVWQIVTGMEPEPPTDALTTTDTFPPVGQCGFATSTDPGNTNAFPLAFEWDDFLSVGEYIGTTTSTTGAYVRLSATFLASQPFHYVTAATSGTTLLAGTVLLDAIQHEEGAAATTFTTAGTCLYPFVRLHAERWPRKWEAAGFAGHTDIPCVDELAMLNKINIPSEYDLKVLASLPDVYYKLDDGAGAQRFPDTSGNHASPLLLNVSKYGVGTLPEPGVAIDVPGMPGSSGVLFTPPASPPSGGWPGTILGCGQYTSARSPGITFPKAFAASWGATIAFWYQSAVSPVPQGQAPVTPFTIVGSPTGTVYSAPLFVNIGNLSGTIGVGSQSPGGSMGVACTNPSVNDTAPHHIVVTVAQDVTNTTITGYVDGVQYGTQTVTTASLGGPYSIPATTLDIGGSFLNVSTSSIVNGTMSRVAMWSRALDGAAVTALYQSGSIGQAGELSGTRTLRHWQNGGYSPAFNTGASAHNANAGVRVYPGSTTMQAPSWTSRIDLLTDTQQTSDAEMGTFWTGPDGAATVEGRMQRWLRLTSKFVLGTDVGSGEIPYLNDLVMDWDPQYVYADVEVSRYGGSTALGGTAQDAQIAARRFYPLSFARSADFETDTQAQEMADWVFNTHDMPYLRVESVTLDPAANTALWPVVLRAEVGQRITLIRRIKQANGGAGLTLTGDFFIEQISHDVDFTQANKWATRLRLSPIGSAAAGISMQPWILGHATYGVLGQTTILGW